MFSKNIPKLILALIVFMGTGCGLGTPTSGHDPNKPLPVIISDNELILVNHTVGAIITTPDGKATLSVPQTSLNADTSFGIAPYIPPKGTLNISIDQMYFFTPEIVSTLIPGQGLIITLSYDPNLLPVGLQESDLRLGLYDPIRVCWKEIFLDSPPIIPGKILHQVTSRNITQLGIFGETTISAPTC